MFIQDDPAIVQDDMIVSIKIYFEFKVCLLIRALWCCAYEYSVLGLRAQRLQKLQLWHLSLYSILLGRVFVDRENPCEEALTTTKARTGYLLATTLKEMLGGVTNSSAEPNEAVHRHRAHTYFASLKRRGPYAILIYNRSSPLSLAARTEQNSSGPVSLIS
ncbi:hypothetical protein IEQ34_008056 [Dendrobium chrysotoxum]|uniref:Uncharacterized protein n=1 Tax=Dendrobium chrysotoxum TaxID=161865 RepID=A0AAV7H738_DENCH|nr:hypothetical protein IEQ34_008056 [Dendrobium chrysotoxum]